MLCNKMSTEEMLSSDDKRRFGFWDSYPFGDSGMITKQRVNDIATAEDLDLLLQELIRADELAWCGHASSRHH